MCDDCEQTSTGFTRNEAILGIKHLKSCNERLGIPMTYTRKHKAKQTFICTNCDTDNHPACVGFDSSKGYCECHLCYLRIPEN